MLTKNTNNFMLNCPKLITQERRMKSEIRKKRY